ncbi:MAG: diguanylate cyclase [Spirochaetales bacterium]
MSAQTQHTVCLEHDAIDTLGLFYIDFETGKRVGNGALREIERSTMLRPEPPNPEALPWCSTIAQSDRLEVVQSVREFLRGDTDELKVRYLEVNRDASRSNIMVHALAQKRDERGLPVVVIGHQEDATELQSLRELVEEYESGSAIRPQEAEALQIAGAVVVSTLDATEAVEAVVDQLQTVVTFDSAMVCELENRMLTFVGGSAEVTQSNWKAFARKRLKRVHGMLKSHAPDLVPPTEDGEPHILLAPINVRRQLLGVMVVTRKDETFSKHEILAIMRMAEFVGIALSNARVYRIMRQRAEIDQLSGVLTRQAFMEAGEKAVDSSFHAKTPVCCLMLDLDHFKSINDSYGHAVGDEVLRKLGSVLNESLRSTDLVGRFGGEEFCAILTETELSVGIEVAERLREKIATTEFLGVERQVTASIGLTGLTTEAALGQRLRLTIEQMVDRADSGLYEAKETGRNRVISSDMKQESTIITAT